MADKKKTSSECCGTGGDTSCTLEGLISVDERGQMVLPKSFREKAGIETGEKIGLLSYEKDGKVCCMVLVREHQLSEMARKVMNPLLGELI